MSLTILSNTPVAQLGSQISTKYMKVEINKKILELPQLCASYSDYDKSKTSNIPLNATIFQYYVNLTRFKRDITDPHTQQRILDNYKYIQNKYAPIVSDVNFWWGSKSWDSKKRNIALQLQEKMDTDFLSDVVDKNETYADFSIRLDDLINYPSKKTKCPSISLRSDIKLLKKQLDLIYSKKIKRFNVDWTGITNLKKWRVLSLFLSNKKIWCNMTSINIKKHRTTLKSYMMLAISYGANTAGFGYYGNGGLNSNSINYKFDPVTLRYVISKNSRDVNDTNSHNAIYLKILNSHSHIRNNTFYSSRFMPRSFVQ